jgi:predicted nuclease of predicted toxin-antitoxin system
MIFLADEGLDALLVELLRKEGYNVIYAAEEMKGNTDAEILARALATNAILITKDKDFGENGGSEANAFTWHYFNSGR